MQQMLEFSRWAGLRNGMCAGKHLGFSELVFCVLTGKMGMEPTLPNSQTVVPVNWVNKQ